MLTTEDVAKIEWIPGDKMIASGLTKQGAQTYDLLRTVQEGRFLLLSRLRGRFLQYLFFILNLKNILFHVMSYVMFYQDIERTCF